LRVSSHVCSRWREAALEIRLSDTGTSRPAGWRCIPLPEVAALLEESPALDPCHCPCPAHAINNNDEADTSIQAAIVKIKAEDSISVGCGGETVSSREEISSKETDVSTEAAPYCRRKNIKRGWDCRNPGRLDNSINDDYSNQQSKECIDFTVDARLEGEGAEVDKSGGGGGGGNWRKRQKLLAGGVKTSKRHALSNKESKEVVVNEEASTEANTTENGGVKESSRQRQQGLEIKDRNDQQELGWTCRFWGAVQRFARRVQ